MCTYMVCYIDSLAGGVWRGKASHTALGEKKNKKSSAAGVVTKTTDRDSSRYTYNGTRRVRQLALGFESN